MDALGADVTTVAPAVTNGSDTHCPNSQEIRNLFLPVVMSIEMIVGLPLNMLALWIFCFRMQCWKAHTLFLFNLVLADFLLIVSVPFRIDTHLRGEDWVFGSVWCRVNHFMLTTNRSASIAFMTVVALHRYFKVVHPHCCVSHITRAQAWILTGVIWASVASLSTPLLATELLHRHDKVLQCRSFNAYKEVPASLKGHYVIFIVEFFLSWFLLLYCSVRISCFLHQQHMDRQKKVRKAILAVGTISLVFTVCFTPGVITGLGTLYVKTFCPTDCASYSVFSQSFKLCIAFTYLNSTLDPIIYNFSSSTFRYTLKTSVSHLCFARNAFTPVRSTNGGQTHV